MGGTRRECHMAAVAVEMARTGANERQSLNAHDLPRGFEGQRDGMERS